MGNRDLVGDGHGRGQAGGVGGHLHTHPELLDTGRHGMGDRVVVDKPAHKGCGAALGAHRPRPRRGVGGADPAHGVADVRVAGAPNVEQELVVGRGPCGDGDVGHVERCVKDRQTRRTGDGEGEGAHVGGVLWGVDQDLIASRHRRVDVGGQVKADAHLARGACVGGGEGQAVGGGGVVGCGDDSCGQLHAARGGSGDRAAGAAYAVDEVAVHRATEVKENIGAPGGAFGQHHVLHRRLRLKHQAARCARHGEGERAHVCWRLHGSQAQLKGRGGGEERVVGHRDTQANLWVALWGQERGGGRGGAVCAVGSGNVARAVLEAQGRVTKVGGGDAPDGVVDVGVHLPCQIKEELLVARCAFGHRDVADGH